MNRKLTAGLLIAAALLGTGAFTALGSVFNYPDVLKEPPAEVLADFRAHQGAVSAGFALLALAAALFAPIAVGVGRLSRHRAMRIAVPVGVAAAVVQVAGLVRWPLLVPGWAADAANGDPAMVAGATDAFDTANRILGNLIGESFGYVLTAAWTLLVLVALRGRWAGRWFTVLGSVSAVLVLAGVLSPLDLPIIDTANFAGYVLWTLWLISFGVLLLVRTRYEAAAAGPAQPTGGNRPLRAATSSSSSVAAYAPPENPRRRRASASSAARCAAEGLRTTSTAARALSTTSSVWESWLRRAAAPARSA
jgi:hypothetical protein